MREYGRKQIWLYVYPSHTHTKKGLLPREVVIVVAFVLRDWGDDVINGGAGEREGADVGLDQPALMKEE